MSKMNLLKLLTLVLLGTTFGYAQASRTWVSGVGDDANPCSRTAPCKTWAGAISKTAPGGEIDALDPGGFGAVTITKAITLDGGGGQVASVLVAGTNGIVVQAAANDVVTIRNIRINGLLGSGNPGLNGIRWTSGKALHIEHCTIFGFSNNGIDIAKSDGGSAFVIDTVTANNGFCGLQSLNTTTTVSTTIERSDFNNIVCGVKSSDFSTMNIKDSEASGNQYGFIAQSSAGIAELNLANSLAANNSVSGLYSGGGTTTSLIRITGVSLFNNPAGMTIAANGTIGSWGNNYNAGTGTPSGTAMPQ
ncbi:MAG TPA: hypothetical protein VK129_04525 [Terriglobales bacterium]|nr:hypothetical protein [Terriglobales bacterium]